MSIHAKRSRSNRGSARLAATSLAVAGILTAHGSPAQRSRPPKKRPAGKKAGKAQDVASIPAIKYDPPPTTTSVGSLEPGVFWDDISYTIRRDFPTSITVSPHEPDVAYAGSSRGYLWKTTDGGKTWDESRLITEAYPFYADAGQLMYFGVHRRSAEAWAKGLHLTGDPSQTTVSGGRSPLLRIRPRRVVSQDKIGLGAPARRAALESRVGAAAQPVALAISPIAIRSGASGGAAANVNFGIGLPGRAPRLQNVVRKFTFTRPMYLGIPIGASGINLKQTLLLRGSRPGNIHRIVIHPTRPNVVFACSWFGLYRSNDAGLTWVRVFAGENPYSSSTRHLAVDPNDLDHILLGTANGLFVSRDGGYNFQKSTAQGMGEGTMERIVFHPADPHYVFVATSSGVLRSTDSGKTWSWIYFTTFPPARWALSVTIDPFDPKRGYVSTFDGIFVTNDILGGSLEDWKRLGGLRLTSHMVPNVVACPKHKGHLWAMTNMILPFPTKPGAAVQGGAFIWESVDNGESWKVIFSGLNFGSVQWMESDPRDPDLLWVACSRSMVRMRRRPSAAVQEAGLARARVAARKAFAKYPSVSDLLLAVTLFGGVEPSRSLGYRALSRLKALVPRLDTSLTYYRLRDYPMLHDGIYGGSLPYRFRQRITASFTEFRAMLTWDLSDLMFQLKASFFGRDARINGELYVNLLHSFHRFYSELRRLHVLLAAVPPKDLRVRLMYKLRIKELESYIDFMSGGYLTRYKKGDHPSPWKTPWFDIWDDIPKRWFQKEYR